MGEVTGTGGEVFANLDIRCIDDYEIEVFDQIRRGIDFGYAVDPFVYVVCHYDKTRRRLFILLSFKSAMREVPSHRIDIEFHRNLPANELELSQMVSNLSGIVSDETLLARLPFVTDAKEEKELVEEEKKRKQASSGGYKTPVKVSEDDEE